MVAMTIFHTQEIQSPLEQGATHEHAWLLESQHTTSQGQVSYVKCAGCGARRVELNSRFEEPPTALSRTIRATS